VGYQVKRFIRIFLPPNSYRRAIVKKFLQVTHLRKFNLATYYDTWFYQNNETAALRPVREEPNNGPLISIIVPAYNTQQRVLLDLVYSITSQSYTNWELVLVNASNAKKAIERIDEVAQIDTRIRLVKTKNLGISANTNKGIAVAKGEYLAFVDHDDILDPFALYEVAKAIRDDGGELIYTDEDKISDDGQTYFDPLFKPDWSPDLFTHVNYINHLTVIKKSLVIDVGLLDPKKDGAQDYDLLLKVVDADPVICHIPKVLYHWRAAQSSTANDFTSKPNITVAAADSLLQHFVRKGMNRDSIKVLPKEKRPGFYSIKLKPYDQISLIITPFASDALLRLYIEILLVKTSLNQAKIELIIPIGTAPRSTHENISVKTLPADELFLREAVSTASYKQITIVSQIVFPRRKNWLNQLSGFLRLNHIGALAPLILRNDKMIEDAGLVHESDGFGLAYLFRNLPLKHQTFLGSTDWIRDVDALTGSCLIARKQELATFLDKDKPSVDFRGSLRRFTISQRQLGKYNMIDSSTLMNNYSIRLQPHANTDKKYFPPGIIHIGDTHELYTPETGAIYTLLRLQEIGLKDGK